MSIFVRYATDAKRLNKRCCIDGLAVRLLFPSGQLTSYDISRLFVMENHACTVTILSKNRGFFAGVWNEFVDFLFPHGFSGPLDQLETAEFSDMQWKDRTRHC
jgi:hypothetical protein